MKKNKTYFVTRHPGAVQWAAQQGFYHAEHVAHLDLSTIRPSEIVIGTLPVHLAAKVIEQGAHYGHLVLDIPVSERGKELTADDMNRLGARIEWFSVSPIPKPGSSTHEHVIYSNSLYDWNDEGTNPQKAHVTIDRCGELNLTVTIKNGDETEPTLVLFAEVDKGVPAVHVSGDAYGESHLHIHSGPDGLYVTPESGDEFDSAPINKFSYNKTNSVFVAIDRSPEDSPVVSA